MNLSRMARLPDIQRVTELPVEDLSPYHDELVEKWSKAYRIRDDARKLRGVQAEALEVGSRMASIRPYMGWAGQIGVGKGKTLICMLTPKAMGAKRSILLCPSDVKKQTLAAEHEWGQEYDIVRTTDDVERWRTGDGRYRLVMSYAQLSQPSSTDLLTQLAPDLIVADEAQALGNPTAARTKRFLRYMKKNAGTTRFVAMSGTLFGKRIMEFYHLLFWSLRVFSPLPQTKAETQIWGSLYDVDGEPDELAWKRGSFIFEWFERVRKEHPEIEYPQTLRGDDRDEARLALGFRIKTCPGMILTTTSSCNTPLHIDGYYPTYSELGRDYLARLHSDHVMPHDAAVDEASTMNENANQLSLGFYYVWDWPNGEPDEEWLEARRAWFGEVRRYLARWDEDGRDSAKLLEDWVREGNGPDALKEALELWDTQRHKPEPPVLTRWFDYGPCLSALDWAREHADVGGIIWFKHRAVGDMLETLGLKVIRKGRVDNLRSKYPVICLPITVYHKGHDLYDWNHQLIMQMPPGGKICEQLLGREHRQGQTKPVYTSVFAHTWKLRQNFERANVDARVQQAITFQPQKLLLATGDMYDDWAM